MVTRYSGRKPMTGKVTIRCDEGVGTGTVLDLSVPGCHFTTSLPLQKGQGLSMEVHLSTQPPLRIELGVVRWAADGEAGVEFIRMSTEDASRLRRCAGDVTMRVQGNNAWLYPVRWDITAG